MAVRSSMADLIARIRVMIADPTSTTMLFQDQDIQDKLDEHRDDVRYLQLTMTPSIVNAASTNNQPSMIFADYYSVGFEWWESDVTLQGNTINGKAWAVLNPLGSDYIVGHFQFELTPFTNGTVPGQYPPVFITGKIYDRYAAAADLLDFKIMSLAATTYDFSSDGQSFRRSQIIDNMSKIATGYRMRAKPKTAKFTRGDVMPAFDSKSVPVLGGDGMLGRII